jgi:hypothetical protein
MRVREKNVTVSEGHVLGNAYHSMHNLNLKKTRQRFHSQIPAQCTNHIAEYISKLTPLAHIPALPQAEPNLCPPIVRQTTPLQ